MAKLSIIKKHFTLKHVSPTHNNTIVFTISQWQLNKSQPGILYLLYRTLITVFAITTWALALTSNFYIYFTMWGYTLCALQFALSLILQLVAVISTRVFGNSYIYGSIFKIYPLYWILHSMSVTAGFVITLIFWTALWNNDLPFTAINFFVHGSNSIILFIDLLIVGHPVRILHLIYPLLFGIVYVIFNISYYYYDINRGGLGYIYIILDWGQPLSASMVVVGLFFLTVFLHLLTYLIHVIKLLIHNKLFPQNIHPEDDPTVSTEQLNREVA